ncbi:MAG TPA: transketolase C-terminal domain-containing protein, partial [Clostridia bacterium]|nr:transketolase C-terminal domain-containing protein [Clostridia bacterium]
GALCGGYVLRDPHDGNPDVILMASGSEVDLIYRAADILSVRGYTARLVSMPCLDLFRRQPKEYQDSVLPPALRRRVAVEAGSTLGWHRYVGLDGAVIGIDHFGASGTSKTLFTELGFTAEEVAGAALRLLGE